MAYTVSREHGCKVVRGEVPLSEMGNLLANADEGDFMDTWLASALDALIVFGSQEACEQAKLELGYQEDIPDKWVPLDFEERARLWLKHGQTGASSLAILRNLTEIRDGSAKPRTDHPRDVHDFRCCALLLRWLPEIEHEMPKMASVSSHWAVFAAEWATLMSLLQNDYPEWPAKLKSPPHPVVPSSLSEKIYALCSID